MTNTLLIDTSIIIDFLRSKEKNKTLLFKLSQKYNLAISIITHSELHAGKSVWRNNKAQKELKMLLSGLQIIPINEKISLSAGKIRAKHTPDLLDALIASTALQNNIPLCTLNIKHFKNIPELDMYEKTLKKTMGSWNQDLSKQNAQEKRKLELNASKQRKKS